MESSGWSLNYNGHFVIGVYNPVNGRGFGRTLPVADIGIIKLLLATGERRGMEWFPHPFFIEHDPFVGYLYFVTGGESELLTLGRQLADTGIAPAATQCGDGVELTARVYAGWVFDHWEGDA